MLNTDSGQCFKMVTGLAEMERLPQRYSNLPVIPPSLSLWLRMASVLNVAFQ
jgi:hypothetical protein